MTPSQLAVAVFAGMRRHGTSTDSARALATDSGQHRATAGRRGALALACVCLLALAGLFTPSSALGALTHPFLSEFTGADTPQGSLGNEAEKLAVRQSTGDVYVITQNLGFVDIFDATGSFLSQIGGFGSFGGSDPDLAVDNSATASEGNLYVLPEFNSLFAFDSSGTPLYELDGSTTPAGSWGPDVCGTAVDSNGNVYVADFSRSLIYRFDSAGNFLTTVELAFAPCDLAVDTDGTMYVIQWNNSLHKLAPDGTDMGVIDGEGPTAVNIDPATHHVYSLHGTFVREFDASGNLVGEFGTNLLANARGVDINGSTGNIYVSSNPAAGSRVLIFGPAAIVPDVITGSATNVATTSATLNGNVDPAGGGDIIDCFFEYGTDTSYGSTAPCVPGAPIMSPTDVSADISGLTPSTIYHFRLVATNANGSSIGADMVFQTEGPPIVQSQPATNITETSATLNAAVDPAGFPTSCVFEYVDDAAFQASGYDTATTVPCVPADLGSVGGTFVQASADVSGLAGSTLYHFRAVATNAAGTTNGADTTFRTAGVPVVVSQSATDITDTTATLNATIIPSGSDTTCEFQYVDDAAFQASGYDTATSVPCSPFNLGSGLTEQDTSAEVSGLTPNTLYHFRVVATNVAGTTIGPDETFQTRESFLVFLDVFGGPGTLAGQFQFPIGVAVDQRGGRVYVADAANARVQKFNRRGSFQGAWGWGVKDGTAESQVCKSRTNCLAGIPGAGIGQFTAPTSVAVDSSKSPSRGSVYVGDVGTNLVQKFNPGGKHLATIDGSTAPQGPFVSVVGVAVDQNGHLWVADAGTQNVIEFDDQGNFLQQWTSPSSIQAIAVDATHDAVYLINGNGTTERFTLTGGGQTTIDTGTGTALAVNPQSGDLYVDHGDDVVIYDHTGAQIDTLFSLGPATDSQGVAYYVTGRGGRSAGRIDRLFVSDAIDSTVAIYGPRERGAPFITTQSNVGAGATSRTLRATIVPLGHKTTCTFQYVSSSDFAMSGYANATTVPCTPADLGSSYTYQQASATISGLTIGTFYHFRVVATNSAGTTTGPDQTFQAGPGAWTPYNRCPVDDPAMLATDGIILAPICVASNSTNGSIQIGILPPTLTGNSNLQGGLVADLNNGIFMFIAPPGGSLIADPATVIAGGVTVLATVESAGTPSDFDLLAGISVGIPILTLPIKIRLVSQTPGVDLGPNCTIGTDMNPIVLHPANTDVSNAILELLEFEADGTVVPSGGPFASLNVTGTTQGDSTFSVPAVSGCGPNGDGSLDAVINGLVGLPSPAGANTLVLENASSALALPNAGQNGVEFAAAWHSAFD